MNYKEIKKEARKNIKHNYFKNVLIALTFTLFLSGGLNFVSRNINAVNLNTSENREILANKSDKSNSEIIDELLKKTLEEKEYEKVIKNKFNKGVLSVFINDLIATKSYIFSILNSINELLGGKVSLAVIIIVSNIIVSMLRSFLFAKLEIGKNRYFLEQRRYLKTSISRCLYIFKRKKKFKINIIILLKNIYSLIWYFTIIGGFIKHYEYSMIPYILAENPDISYKDAFRLSKKLTDNHKLELFKIDLSLLGYHILGACTFNIFNYLYTNVYKETLYSEIYINLRNLNKDELLNDELLNIKEKVNEKYCDIENNKRVLTYNIDYDKNYSLNSYILFFFTFSFVGWIWEVILHLIYNGEFINKGALYGPWLPIYGAGGVLILSLLKRYRKNPWKLFFSTMILCGIVEYLTAWYLETVNHLKYWDYSGYFLNIQGRICLEGLLIFAIGGCAFTYLFAPLLEELYSKINKKLKKIICIVLIILFSIDYLYATFVVPNQGEGITSEVIEK